MVYLYIILLVGIAFLILERQRFFGKKEDSNTPLESNNQDSINAPRKKGFFDGIFSGNYFQREEFKQDNTNAINMQHCEICGGYFDKNQMISKDNKYICNNCASK